MATERWEKASKCEHDFWLRWKERTNMSEARAELVEQAKKIEQIINKHLPGSEHKILQIGPGPNGQVHFMKGRRFALDPLNSFYRETFPELIDRAVECVDGMGEELPYEDAFFDVILGLNILDHCRDPKKTIAESWRSLRPGGLLLVGINLFLAPLTILHQILGFMDPEHPHAFCYRKLQRLMDGFTQLEESSIKTPLVKYNLYKMVPLLLLRSFSLAPKYYTFVFKK